MGADWPVLVAAFAHPTSRPPYRWGTNAREPYLLEVVQPTVAAIHQRLGLA